MAGDLLNLHMSFTYVVSSNGPRTEPWGMPVLIELSVELSPFTAVNCFLLSR